MCGDEGMDFGGESEGEAPLSRSAYDGMRRVGAMSTKPGGTAGELFAPVPAKEWGQERYCIYPYHRKN